MHPAPVTILFPKVLDVQVVSSWLRLIMPPSNWIMSPHLLEFPANHCPKFSPLLLQVCGYHLHPGLNALFLFGPECIPQILMLIKRSGWIWSPCRTCLSAEWLLTNSAAWLSHLLLLPRHYQWYWAAGFYLALFECTTQWNTDCMFQKPSAGQLILYLTVIFACGVFFLFFFHILSPLPAVCQPAAEQQHSHSVQLSLAQRQPYWLSEDQRKQRPLSVCVHVCNWVALPLAGNSVGDLQPKAILLVRPSVQSVSVATVAFWSHRRTRKINHLLLAKMHPIPKKKKKKWLQNIY